MTLDTGVPLCRRAGGDSDDQEKVSEQLRQLHQLRRTKFFISSRRSHSHSVTCFLPSDSAHQDAEKFERRNITRENMSLPSNMQLHDLNTLRKGQRSCNR